MINRHSKILEVLSKQQRVEVSTLSVMLGVSQVTIRKDLDMLEEKGLVIREHGCACLDGCEDTGKRIAYHHNIKRRIAKAAAATVSDGDTVMIESGSCCALLAEELVLTKKDVTVVTNSVFLANYIRHSPGAKIILLGGYYQPVSQVTVGPITRQSAAIFFPSKFFIGADGFSSSFGFTGNDHIRVQTINDLAEHTRGIVVLTESEKFKHQGVLGMARTDSVNEVFTDDAIPADAEKILLKHNVIIHKVAANES